MVGSIKIHPHHHFHSSPLFSTLISSHVWVSWSMARLDMYNENNEHKPKPPPPPICPRISFSNDFVVESAPHSHHPQMGRSYRDAPVSSDFEFSVTNDTMMTADELFSQGRLLPLKESCGSSSHRFPRTTTTLREELLVEDDGGEEFSLRPPKSSAKWKGFLGLKKSQIGSRKIERGEGSAADHKRSSFVLNDEPHHPPTKPSQEMLNDGGGQSSTQVNQDQFRL